MILAEKIMKHRKQNGWSQEELAVRLKVSRQSVSKWESGASMPDLDKIIKLSELVALILMGGLAEYKNIGLTEDMAGGIGVTILLLMIAAAVAMFILFGMPLGKYEYMEREALSLQYGVAGIVEVKKEEFEPVHKICVVLGVTLCIISAVPLMIAAAFHAPDLVYIYCVDVLLVIVAFAVFLFVWSGMIYGSYQKLLEEGEYLREKKLENKRNDNLAKVYWCTATAIYLGISFVTGKWHITWVVWPCVGVLYAAVCGLAAMIRGK